MTYNLSGISGNTSGLLGLFQGVNNVLMFGWLGVLMLIVIFMISFMTFLISSQDVPKSLTASSFIIAVMAILLAAMDLISSRVLFITWALAAASIAMTTKFR